VSTIVHNDMPQPQRVRVRLHASGALIDTGPETTLDVAAGDSVRTDWPVTLTEPGTATFTASAVANSGANDAMQKPVPVVPHGSESRTGLSGELRDPSATLSLDLPAGAIPAATSCQLTVSASPSGVMLQGLEYIHAQEFGTTENAVGWFLPDMTVAM